MKKSAFKEMARILGYAAKHVAKRKAFAKLVDNPPGTKFRKARNASSGRNRAADGTLRR